MLRYNIIAKFKLTFINDKSSWNFIYFDFILYKNLKFNTIFDLS